MPLFMTPMNSAPIDHVHHLADAARSRHAADEAGRDDVELEPIAGARRRRIEPRGDDEARQRREQAHIGEGQEDEPFGLHAGELRGEQVAAERIDAPSDDGPRGDEVVRPRRDATMITRTTGRPL